MFASMANDVLEGVPPIWTAIIRFIGMLTPVHVTGLTRSRSGGVGTVLIHWRGAGGAKIFLETYKSLIWLTVVLIGRYFAIDKFG